MRALLRVVAPATAGLAGVVLLSTILLGAHDHRLQQATFIVTSINDNGPGTLRDTIATANDGDIIEFDPAINGQSINLTTGELVIDKNITISGPGPDSLTVSEVYIPKFLYRIFHVQPGHTITIAGLTISGGYANGSGGGGILNDHSNLTINNCNINGNHTDSQGAGIHNDGSGSNAALTIFNSTISANQALSTQAIVAGGGIASDASNGGSAILTIADSLVTGNTAEYQGQGNGGGIYNDGTNATLVITNTTVNNNRAGSAQPAQAAGLGGGIWNSGSATINTSIINLNNGGLSGGGIRNSGTLSITGSTVNNNHTGGNIGSSSWGNGGGINNSGTLTITSTTLSANFALAFGGALYGNGIITNSAITANTGSFGGGIYGSPNLTNCTISGNSGGGISGGGIIRHSTFTSNAGGGIDVAGSLDIGNTILRSGPSGPNINFFGGTVTSHGYNLSDDDGGGFLTGPGDQINTDPLLGPLQDNGGPTVTHDLLPGSPALDAGDPGFTPPPTTDQRGYSRVYGGRIDIGSVEAQPSPARSLNLSTRMFVRENDLVGIAGFIITGASPKQVLVRGIGPSLGNLGVPNPLQDPVTEVHGPIGFDTITNDNWRDTQEAQIQATGIPPGNDLESAILVTLNPGAYTAILKGNNGGTGVGLVEVYDLSSGTNSKLANISTRCLVQTGNDIMIAGFILGGNNGPDTIVVRGIGPSLAGTSLPALADPQLELRDNNGQLIQTNNNWMDNSIQAALIMAAGLAPTNPLESALYETLPPGPYTALLSGVNNGQGVGLVEVYDLGVTGPIPSPSPSVSPTPSPGPPCLENWDSVAAPALPPGWVASNPDPGDGVMWVTSTVTPDSAPNDAFVPDQDGLSDKVLDRLGVNVTSANATLSFRNNFNTEFSNGIYWDGYVLEVSAPNISGGDFLDITDPHVGGSFVSGGYTGEICCGTCPGPLPPRMAWSGDSAGYIDTVINLGPNLVGQTVTFRFRMCSDAAVAAPGVYIDNLVFTDATCP